ncbi:type II secretion system F family protein [Fusibacter ferrireducens]|uniref:Type II secretion system protein GspF domain-containing protein n=1 Tax=Fusibacter ferrireducens TaxID=2785058 RepID=A0ABR9ZN10_9FIRM|nr:hypothetical protein [Fusibacter ferrireducens]MBF4691850.1 hypothetical protein [Fusibacter ferrireducens]
MKSENFFKYLKSKDFRIIFFDLTFYILGIKSFYNSFLLLPLPVIVIAILIKFSRRYDRNYASEISFQLIEFLNYINSNLSIGMSFEHAILSYEKDRYSSFDDNMRRRFEKLINAIRMGVSQEQLLGVLETVFPIRDTKRFASMLIQSMKTGANQSFIVSITLDKLYIKHKTESEIQMILYQKKTEQMILCMAPMLVILMIRGMSPEYLMPLYTEVIGRMIMTFSFSLLVAMKLISKKIIQIEV